MEKIWLLNMWHWICWANCQITRSFEFLPIALNKSKVYTTITYVAWYINRLLQKRKNCFWNFHLSANWTRHTYIKSNVILSSNWCVILFLFEFTSSWSSLFNLKKQQFQHDFSSSLTFDCTYATTSFACSTTTSDNIIWRNKGISGFDHHKLYGNSQLFGHSLCHFCI